MFFADGKIEERARCRNYLKIGAFPERRRGQHETDRAERLASAGAKRAASALLRRLATRAGGGGSTTSQQGILTGARPINAAALRQKLHFPHLPFSIKSGKCSDIR